MEFTKTWRSDAVPGGLVLRHQQSHTEIGGKPFRNISETIYAPFDGVTPTLGDARPPAAETTAVPPNRGVPAPAAIPQPPATSAVPAPADRTDLMKHYNEVMTRMTRARVGLAQWQRTRPGVPLPAD